MTRKPSPDDDEDAFGERTFVPEDESDVGEAPAAPPPEVVDQALTQALTVLFNAMEQGQPDDERGEDMGWKVTRLDHLASCYQVAGDALRVAVQKRAALLRRQRNALIPINLLPSELLSAILVKSVDDDRHAPNRINSLQKLAQVAWQWWQTIKSDPQFWTYITPPMEGVELQIRRAGILPLRLNWTGGVDVTDYRDEPEDVDFTDWDAVGDLIQRYASRWTGIELEHYDRAEAVFQALCTSHLPQLKYLRFHLSKISTTISENWRFDLAQYQNLQEVHLPIMPYLPLTPSSNSPIHLRTLHLNLLRMESYSSHDLESLLRLAPQLVELKVKNLFADTNPPAPLGAPIIDLPNLRCLEFTDAVTGDEREWIPLLAQIRAPRMEILGLHYGRQLDIGGQTIFTALVTWPSTSKNRPEDAPLHSVLRNAGPSAAWRVDCYGHDIAVEAEGSGSGRLDITLGRRPFSSDEIAGNILKQLTPFGLQVDLVFSIRHRATAGLEFWDEVLDASPTLRIFALVSSVEIAREVIDRLSTKTPSSSSTSPRAPHLEKLSFELENRGAAKFTWVPYDLEEAVKTMLDKRRETFIQGGVIDPPKLVVTGAKGSGII